MGRVDQVHTDSHGHFPGPTAPGAPTFEPWAVLPADSLWRLLQQSPQRVVQPARPRQRELDE
ncbi:hypothetical protein [Lysobacter sp. A3-1-A15]|uniref:hypothetical protein n=1 Tax=Novilysobacter viscosus TaxID=3098602 RepID=UPI002ED7E0EA